MSRRIRRWRRPICGLVVMSLAAWETPAAAVDKVACVQAAEAGQRLRSRSQLVSAREQLLVCASAECPPVVSQDCTGWLGEVQRSLASVVIRARDAGGQVLTDVGVSVDGKALPERAPTAAIDLDPGEHAFRCERAGYAEAVERATLAEGERGREIVCTLMSLAPLPAEVQGEAAPAAATRETPAPPPPSSALPWVVWPLGAVGVLGIGSFAALALSAKSDEGALSRTCAPYCSSAQVEPVGVKYAVADVSLAVGVAALGAATIIGLIHASGSRRHGASHVAAAAR